MDSPWIAAIGAVLGGYVGRHYWGKTGLVAGGVLGCVAGIWLPKLLNQPEIVTEVPVQVDVAVPPNVAAQQTVPGSGGLYHMNTPTTQQRIGTAPQQGLKKIRLPAATTQGATSGVSSLSRLRVMSGK